MRILTLAALASAMGCAQNSDLAIMLSGATTEVMTGPNRATTTEVNYLLNYAYQIRESGPHRLYVEFPLAPVGGGTVAVDRNAVSVGRNSYFFTPGVRYQYTLSPRVVVYGATGLGLSRYRRVEVRASPAFVSSTNDSALGWNAGGGIGFRWTRLLSLRLEARNFGRATGPAGKRNHLVVAGGLALHF